MLFIDLDRFKNINDSLGHKAGDELLQQLAIRIKEKVRLDDTVARISGDEFVVLLENIGSAENTAVTVEKIMSVFNESFILDRHYKEPGGLRIILIMDISLWYVARKQLQHSDFIDKVRAILDDTELPADRLELEVTEGIHNA